MFPFVPKATPVAPCVTMDHVFTAYELDRLEMVAADATETGDTGDKLPIRRSKVRWLDFDPANLWAYQRVAEVVSNINAQHYRFDIVGLGEPMQLARYEADDRGHYDWHQDYGGVISRKLSVTVQLTDPNVYDGGDLEVMATGKTLRPGRDRGMVIVFPAYQLHRITPVAEGVRHSLVAWVSGPAFR
jgi:PKHD-type hydroxylase